MKFEPGLYTKAWIAWVGSLLAQWGIETDSALGQIVLTPPDSWTGAGAAATIVGGLVWWFSNNTKKEDKTET